MGKYYGLTRASTTGQEESPKIQAERIVAHCNNMTWGEPNIRHEPLGTSGTIPFRHRVQGRWFLLNLKAGDTLIVTDVDRLGRNAVDIMDTAERLKKMGVRLLILQFLGMDLDVSTEGGYMLLWVYAMGAQYEHRRIRDRTHAAVKRKQELNMLCIKPGFGKKRVYDDNGGSHAEWDHEQLKIIAGICERRSRGHTVKQIAEDLWANGVLDHRGVLWGKIESNNRGKRGAGPYANIYRVVTWFHRQQRTGKLPPPYGQIGSMIPPPPTFTEEVRRYTRLVAVKDKTDPRENWTADQWREWAKLECPNAEISAITP